MTCYRLHFCACVQQAKHPIGSKSTTSQWDGKTYLLALSSFRQVFSSKKMVYVIKMSNPYPCKILPRYQVFECSICVFVYVGLDQICVNLFHEDYLITIRLIGAIEFNLLKKYEISKEFQNRLDNKEGDQIHRRRRKRSVRSHACFKNNI